MARLLVWLDELDAPIQRREGESYTYAALGFLERAPLHAAATVRALVRAARMNGAAD